MSIACLSGDYHKTQSWYPKIYSNLMISETVFGWNEWRGSVVSSIRLPRPVLLLNARVVFLLRRLLGWSSEIQMTNTSSGFKPTHWRLSELGVKGKWSQTWHTRSPDLLAERDRPDISGLWFSLDNVFVQLHSHDVRVRHLKHGLE